MKHVLFVCNHNAGRSQGAQGLFEQHVPIEVRHQTCDAPAAP